MKKKSGKFGPRLTVSLTGDDHHALQTLAKVDEVSVSWVIRRAIEEYLSKHSSKTNGAVKNRKRLAFKRQLEK